MWHFRANIINGRHHKRRFMASFSLLVEQDTWPSVFLTPFSWIVALSRSITQETSLRIPDDETLILFPIDHVRNWCISTIKNRLLLSRLKWWFDRYRQLVQVTGWSWILAKSALGTDLSLFPLIACQQLWSLYLADHFLESTTSTNIASNGAYATFLCFSWLLVKSCDLFNLLTISSTSTNIAFNVVYVDRMYEFLLVLLSVCLDSLR